MANVRITRELIELGKENDFKILNFELAQYCRTCTIKYGNREFFFTFFEDYPFKAPTVRTEENINGTTKYAPYVLNVKDWNPNWTLSAIIVSIDLELNDAAELAAKNLVNTTQCNKNTHIIPYNHHTNHNNCTNTPYDAHRTGHAFSHGCY